MDYEMMVELKVCWSPKGQCWRVKDGRRHSFSTPDAVVAYLRTRSAAAVLTLDRKGAMRQALNEAGIPIV